MDNNYQEDIFNTNFNSESYYDEPRKKERKIKPLYIIIAVAVCVIIGLGAFFVGYSTAKSQGLYNDMPLLVEAYGYLKRYYYEDISWEDFQTIAAKAVLSNVDAFTGMYEYNFATGTISAGVHLNSNVYNYHTVSYVIPESPASVALAVAKYDNKSLTSPTTIDTEVEKVKIDIGDRIYALAVNDGTPLVIEHAQNSAFKSILSRDGVLTMYVQKSDGFGNYLDGYYKFNIVKQFIESKQAFYYTSSQINDPTNKVAMIRLDSFTETAVEDFLACVNKFGQERKEKLILDLRDNGGGDSEILGLISACLLKGADVSDLNIAYYKYNNGSNSYAEKYFTSQRTYDVKENNKVVRSVNAINLPALDYLKDKFEVIVLCNGGSASCSEVIIGALQFYNNSQIVGARTYGKGVAQSQIPLSDGKHYVVITNGKYYIPTKGLNGQTLWETSIHEVGFVPKDENIISSSSYRPFENDEYIQRALQILNN